jgi:alanyl-tRNA synthetase
MRQSSVIYRHVICILMGAVWSLVAVPSPAQITTDLSERNMSDADRRDATLLWLDSFLTDSDLLRSEDIAKIREAVRQMSPTQLQQWLEQTRQLREYVEGERWQETRRWLREFMRVQAIYSDQELQALRNEIVQADAQQMLAILKRIQARHDTLVWMHQASDRKRQVEVQERDARMAQQATLAEAARARSATAAAAAAVPGTAGGGAARPSTGFQSPGPLVTSREMARAAVWSELWGPGFIFGF